METYLDPLLSIVHAIMQACKCSGAFVDHRIARKFLKYWRIFNLTIFSNFFYQIKVLIKFPAIQ